MLGVNSGSAVEGNLKFIFLGDQRVAAVTASPTLGSEVLYYHADHLGGANVLTNADGTKKELIEYEPFGLESRHEKYGSSEEVAWYYFTGKPKDDESGLYYFGARYYDPKLGRFITADTIVPSASSPQTLNRYTYVYNNPVNSIDADGHFGWFIPFIVAAIKGAAIGATIGAATAVVTGGDVGKGALFGAIGGAVFAGMGSLAQGLTRFATVPGGIGPMTAGATITANILGGAIGGAAAGAAVSGTFGGDVGLGALAGLAGGVAGFAGGYYLAPSAGSVLGNVASAAVTREDLDRAAYLGFIDSSVMTTIELMIPEPTIRGQGVPEGGDLIFYRGTGFTDPAGLFLSYLQGAPIAHDAIAISATRQVDSHVAGGVKDRPIQFKRQGRLVKWAGTGNQEFVALAVQYGKENAIKYGLGPGRELCSTFCGRVGKESGLSLPGFSPSSQYNNLQGAQYYNTYGIQGR